MTVTPFSVITSILLCNVFFIIIALLRRRNSFIINFSLIPLILLIVSGIFRLIYFVEFSNAIVIESNKIFPAIMDIFNKQLFTVYNDISIHIHDLLIAVWFIGGIYNLLKYVHQSISLYHSVNAISGTHDIRIVSIMDEIIAKSYKNTKVKIIKSREITVPMIAGYFKPVICLPDITFSDDELKNILIHEWTHYLNKDAWAKFSMYFLCSVFWWNPFVHLLRRELDHILEIQCDLSITSQMDEQRRISYLESILKVIREARNITVLHTTPMNCAALVSTNNTQKIEQRFNLVLEYNSSSKKQHKFHILLMCSMILLTFLASYKLVIQPVYSAPAQSQEEIFDINPENSYLILNENGTYSLYADGKYRCDIPNIDTEPFSLLPVK